MSPASLPRVRASRSPIPGERNRPLRIILCTVVALVTVVLIVVALQPVRTPPTAGPASPSTASDGSSPGRASAQADAIAAAAAAPTWPRLVPGVSGLAASRAGEWLQDGCLDGLHTATSTKNLCVYGDPKGAKQAVLLGDEVAISWAGTIRAALGAGWTLHVLTLSECPAHFVTVTHTSGAPFPDCDGFHAWTTAEIQRIRPAITFVSSATESTERLASGAVGQRALAEWSSKLSAALKDIRLISERTVILQAPPHGKDLASCAHQNTVPADCSSVLTDEYLQHTASERAAIAAVGDATVSYLTTLSWFCTEAGVCPAFSGTTPIFADGAHLTAQYAQQLGPALRQKILRQITETEATAGDALQ